MPARSPAGRYTDWSTLKPRCVQVRMFSTTSGSILSSASGAPGTPGRGEHGFLPGRSQPPQVQLGQLRELALREWSVVICQWSVAANSEQRTKDQEQWVLAVRAADAGEAPVQVAALEKGRHRAFDDGA